VGSHVRLWSVVAAGLSLDLWSKQWAFLTMGQHGNIPLIPRVLEFQTMLNKGALFGIGGGLTNLFLLASVAALVLVGWMFAQSSRRRWALHIALGGIVGGALGNMYDRSTVRLIEERVRTEDRRLVYGVKVGEQDGYALLREYPPERENSAAIRMRLSDLPGEVGFVRDFLKIPTHLPSWVSRPVFGRPDQELWPWVFNVADSLLVGGVGILAFQLWRERRPPRADGPAAPGKAG
jgi:lipoprotein signal peptidase